MLRADKVKLIASIPHRLIERDTRLSHRARRIIKMKDLEESGSPLLVSIVTTTRPSTSLLWFVPLSVGGGGPSGRDWRSRKHFWKSRLAWFWLAKAFVTWVAHFLTVKNFRGGREGGKSSVI